MSMTFSNFRLRFSDDNIKYDTPKVTDLQPGIVSTYKAVNKNQSQSANFTVNCNYQLSTQTSHQVMTKAAVGLKLAAKASFKVFSVGA
jgi:hypothetical protein